MTCFTLPTGNCTGTVIKGRRFPTYRHSKGIRVELSHAAKHVSQIDYFEEEHAEGPLAV